MTEIFMTDGRNVLNYDFYCNSRGDTVPPILKTVQIKILLNTNSNSVSVYLKKSMPYVAFPRSPDLPGTKNNLFH